jgi:Flp pilus assembly protein TadG
MALHPSLRMKRRLQGDSGMAAVEFAILASVLLLLVMGLADYGLAVYYRMQVESAALIGAKYAAKYPTDSAGITSAVNSATHISSFTSVTPAKLCECANALGTSVSCSTTCAGSTLNEYMTVTVTYSYTPLFASSPLPIETGTLSSTHTIRTK